MSPGHGIAPPAPRDPLDIRDEVNTLAERLARSRPGDVLLCANEPEATIARAVLDMRDEGSGVRIRIGKVLTLSDRFWIEMKTLHGRDMLAPRG